MTRCSEPWQDPVLIERARLAARAIGSDAFTSAEVVRVVGKAIGCKAPSVVAGVLATAEDFRLVSYSPDTCLWSCTKRPRKKRAPSSAWTGYVSPSETGMLVANRNGSVSVTSVASPRPLRHFVNGPSKSEVTE